MNIMTVMLLMSEPRSLLKCFLRILTHFYQHFISECPAVQMKHETSWNYHFKCIITIGLTNPILLSEYALRKHFLEMRKC